MLVQGDYFLFTQTNNDIVNCLFKIYTISNAYDFFMESGVGLQILL